MSSDGPMETPETLKGVVDPAALLALFKAHAGPFVPTPHEYQFAPLVQAPESPLLNPSGQAHMQISTSQLCDSLEKLEDAGWEVVQLVLDLGIPMALVRRPRPQETRSNGG